MKYNVILSINIVLHGGVKMKLVSSGVLSERELDINNPIVFESDSKFSSMSYAGGIEIVDKSQTISDAEKEKLKKIQGKFSIGSTSKNLHLYSPKAEVLDGRNRICYIIGNQDELIISEYNSPRGDKYSALYCVLIDILHEEGFKSYKGDSGEVKFNIHLSEVDLFVQSCNKVIELHLNDMLEVKVSNEFYTISRKNEDGENYNEYFFKTFYINKNNEILVNPYKLIAKKIVSVKTNDELLNISSKLNNIKTLLENKKLELETIENL